MTAASNVARIRKAPAKKAAPKPSVAAREAEATDGYVEIEHRGVKVRIPMLGKVPVAAIDAFRAGDNYEGTKQLIGAEQWKQLSDAGLTAEEVDELGRKLNEAQGN